MISRILVPTDGSKVSTKSVEFPVDLAKKIGAVIKIGPLETTVETEKTIPLPLIMGGLALEGGIVLVIIGAKR